ncbi:hypothetical protein WS67_21680 [Burkholderia singularis]|uniref:Uncharacterized protein n=1 Tax=Burkholderia singularis TaxID=1503053 RepID=A0A103DW53_9BURK|nr:hypothetical protein WS67_21680 [Burkholderia singularis]
MPAGGQLLPVADAIAGFWAKRASADGRAGVAGYPSGGRCFRDSWRVAIACACRAFGTGSSPHHLLMFAWPCAKYPLNID